MQAIGVADHIPISAVRSLGTASGVDDATKAEVRRALGLANSAAAGQPARPGRRWCRAEIATQRNINVRGVISEHLDVFAQRAERGPGRQSGRIHANGVIADGWHLYLNNSQAVSGRATRQ